MKTTNDYLKDGWSLSLIVALFFLGIIVISFKMWIAIGSIFIKQLVIYKVNMKYRFLTLLFCTFLFSLLIYQWTIIFINGYEILKEVKVLLNRALLGIIIAGLYLLHLKYKKPMSFFTSKPNWKQRLDMPLHSIPLSHFMLIGVLISVISFMPMIIQQDSNGMKSLVIFSLLFSIINATLEELLWRGILLSSLKNIISDRNSVFITSVGFGLLHLIVGIPFIISLLFSLGGVIYALVVLQTKSLYPAILLHFVINMGMVWSGLII